jgi:hypothetical protein
MIKRAQQIERCYKISSHLFKYEESNKHKTSTPVLVSTLRTQKDKPYI